MPRSMSVANAAAIAANDQYATEIRRYIERLDRNQHHLIAEALHEIRRTAANASRDEISELGIDGIGLMAFLIASASGIVLMNDVALEKWGPNGTEVA